MNESCKLVDFLHDILERKFYRDDEYPEPFKLKPAGLPSALVDKGNSDTFFGGEKRFTLASSQPIKGELVTGDMEMN